MPDKRSHVTLDPEEFRRREQAAASKRTATSAKGTLRALPSPVARAAREMAGRGSQRGGARQNPERRGSSRGGSRGR